MRNGAQKIAVTGATGRLGSALIARLRDAIPWSRPDYDLDDPSAAERLLERDRPHLVVHPAAWTDVDGCARQPELAQRRNAAAVKELAFACAARGVGLVLVSTNEVFNGERSDGHGYVESDVTDPPNPYGATKLEGELAARSVMGDDGLWVVRTAWLYGPPGNDFPSKIVAAADRLGAHEPLTVVRDEWGSPTYAPDLADGILTLVARTSGGLFHIVNRGAASRLEWAEHVLRRCRPGRTVSPISRREFVRASRVPAWGVLDSTLARERAGFEARPWDEALEEYLARMC